MPTFFADECISTRIVEGLRERGFDVIEAKDVCRGDSDKVALSLSAAAGRIMITDDWGFGELAIRQRQPAIGVIILLCSSRPQAGGFRRRTHSDIGQYLFWEHHSY
jgi:predicted nuclease of predicted toxin-antitoxin system